MVVEAVLGGADLHATKPQDFSSKGHSSLVETKAKRTCISTTLILITGSSLPNKKLASAAATEAEALPIKTIEAATGGASTDLCAEEGSSIMECSPTK